MMRATLWRPWLLPWVLAGSLLGSGRAAADPAWFRPLLVGELDYRVYSHQVEGEQGFALGRLRLGLEARPAPWIQAVGTIDWGLEKPAVVDAVVVLSPAESVRVRLGFGKTPLFASARDVNIQALPIPELSLPVRALWPGRDLGLEVQWAPRGVPLEGWVRVGNGSRSPLGNDNAAPALDARVDGLLGRDAWGLRMGAGVHAESAFDRAGIGGTTATGFLFYRPVPVSGGRWVTEAHALFWHGPLRLLAEAGLAREQRSRDTDGNPQTPREALPAIGARGASLEASWMVRGVRPHGRDWPEGPSEGPSEGPMGEAGAWGGGAVELTARAEWLAVGLDAADVTPGGARGGSAAIRWWTTPFLAVTAAGYWLRYDAPPLESPDRRDSWLVLSRVTVNLY